MTRNDPHSQFRFRERRGPYGTKKKKKTRSRKKEATVKSLLTLPAAVKACSKGGTCWPNLSKEATQRRAGKKW